MADEMFDSINDRQEFDQVLQELGDDMKPWT